MHEDVDALGIERPTHEPRATEYVPQMLSTIVEPLEHKGLAYRVDRRRRELRGAQVPRLRQAVGQVARRAACRRARGRARRQGRSARLRCCGRAPRPTEPDDVEVGQRLRRGPPRLAHRVLGHGLRSCWARPSTSTAAAPTCSFRITRTRSRRAKAPPASRWRATGCTTASSTSTTRRCPRAWATSSLIRDVLKKFDAETRALLRRARALPQPAQLQRRAPRRRARLAQAPVHRAATWCAPAPVAIDWAEPHAARFKAAMDEDFGTPEAVAVLFDLAGEVNRTQSPELAGLLKALGGCLGLLQGDPQAFLQAGTHARRGDDPGPDRAARRRQGGEELRRGRPHPQRTAGPGHRAEGLADRHDLDGRPVNAKTTMPAAKEPSVEVFTPDYWEEACKHLAKKDRVMKRLIPQFGDACLRVARRCLHHAGAQHRRPADLGEGGADPCGTASPSCRAR